MISYHDLAEGEHAAASPTKRKREEAVDLATSTVILIAQSKDDLAPYRTNSKLAAALALVSLDISGNEQLGHFLRESVENQIFESKDSSSSFEFLSPDSSGKFRKIVVALLPTSCTRNNSPARPHAVSGIVNKHKHTASSASLAIIFVGMPAEFSFAQALAVSRCFPTYSQTSSARKAAAEAKPADQVHVFLSLPVGVTVETLANLAKDIRHTQHLVDMPPSELNCSHYVGVAESVARELSGHSVSIKVIRGEELDKQGLGGIWGVGKASDHPPALVILSHIPAAAAAAGSALKSVCLVGKGIVYDTGGLSIKVPPGMVEMKTDMGGSAAVLGSFRSLVLAGGIGRPLHALLCIAENSVDSKSFRPDDILYMLSGKTVEVNNTDAEGRLVLGDGVFYAADRLNPGLVVDIATLTGAQLVCTGRKHAAVYCSSETIDDLAIEAGKYSGDLAFPMLYCPEFHRGEFRSVVADMKNSVADRMNAQSSCAGCFIGNHLEAYLDAGGQWAHVDMAGPSFDGGRATGYGVGLLFEMARRWQGQG